MEVARTSMIHAAAPHFLWPFAVQYAAHQLNLWPRVSLPETLPTLRWTGKVGDAVVFRVCGSRAFVRDTSAEKLSAHAIPCVFLGFSPDAPGWQFYHPTSRRVLPSEDVTFDESVPFYRSCSLRCISRRGDPLPGTAPVEVAVGSGAARGAASGGAEPGGAESEGARSWGAELGGAEPGGAEPEGVELRGAESEGAESGSHYPRQLREWFAQSTRLRSGAARAGDYAAGDSAAGDTRAGGSTAADPGGARTEGTGAAETVGAGAGGVRAVDPGAGGAGGTVRPRPYFFPLIQQVLGVLSSTGLPPPLLCPPPDQSQLPLQLASPLLAPSPYTEQTGGLTKRREPASCRVSPIRTGRRVPCPRPPPVPGTYAIALRPSSVPLRVPLPPPPEPSLPAVLDPESDRAPTASPTVSRLLATIVTAPSFESTAASALIAELEDFECLAAAVPCFASMLLALEGDPDAPDIPTPRSYAEAITGTYIVAVPPSWANIVDGMRIFRRDYELHSLDFSTAFLQGSLHEEIWLRRPPGFTRTTLAALGFTPSTADTSLFLRTDTSLPPFYVPIYITPDRAWRTITRTQSHMVHQVLQRFGFQFSSPQPTPLSTGQSLSAPPSDESVEPSGPYPELVGCLMYLMTCTRPDLAYPLSLLAHYFAPRRHRKVHWDAAKRVLCCLCNTLGMGLVLGGRGPVVLTSHIDASWVEDSATQRLSQGYTFSLDSGFVSWRSTRSSSVLSSSCEAEIYAGAMAAQELHWLTYLLTDLGEQPRSPPVLCVPALHPPLVSTRAAPPPAALPRRATCCRAAPSAAAPCRQEPSRTAQPSRAAPPSHAAQLSRAALLLALRLLLLLLLLPDAPAATAATTTMASPTVLTFDAEGCAVDFDVLVDDLQLFLQCDSRDGVSLFDHTSGVSTAPDATADNAVRSQWTTRDAVARLAVHSHLPPAERAHFGQYKNAKSLYDIVVARYSSPATVSLSRLMLPYLFPDLAAFATVADLITHLRTSDARYRAALPTDSTQRGGFGGSHRQQPPRSRETPSAQQLREWYAGRGRSRGAGPCTYVIRTSSHHGETCGLPHTAQRCFGCLTDAWCAKFPHAVELPRLGDLHRQNVAIFDLDFDAILAAIYALTNSAEGDCYLSVPPDQGIEAAALGASASAAPGAGESAAPRAGESALSGTAPTKALHTFTLDYGASRSFFRDSTTLTPLSRPVAVSLADPFGSQVLAHSSTVLPCPAALSGLLSGLHLPSFSTNLVSGADLQDAWVYQFAPGGQHVTQCICSRTGRHLATFTRRPGSSLYTLTTTSPPVSAFGHVAASSQVFAVASRSSPASAPWSCRPLSHETLLWHHCLRLRGMASRTLVSGLPQSLPPLPPGPAPTCVPCVKGRQHAAPHSSTFPPTEAPLQTLHMDVCVLARVRGQGHERYFLLVIDDYSRYTTVFPLRSKSEVPEVLIEWIRDRGGEFSPDLPRAFCRAEGMRQTFTLPASPQQNGIAERRIGMVMDFAHTSMIHAAAPYFLWPFAVQYAAHQINL
ncbi:unnamed protein product [Closterium sp. NIES-53]